jgi:hypothetical protein
MLKVGRKTGSGRQSFFLVFKSHLFYLAVLQMAGRPCPLRIVAMQQLVQAEGAALRVEIIILERTIIPYYLLTANDRQRMSRRHTGMNWPRPLNILWMSVGTCRYNSVLFLPKESNLLVEAAALIDTIYGVVYEFFWAMLHASWSQ